MHRTRLVIITLLVSLVASAAPAARPAARIHSVVDISHAFSFYFDGRFARNYLVGKGNVSVQNWGTLHKFDFDRVNLVVLQSGASSCQYTPKDIAAIKAFLESGGGVIVLGDYALFRDEKTYTLNALAKAFGAKFVNKGVKKPITGLGELKGKAVKNYGGKTITLTRSMYWEMLIKDAAGRCLMARRNVGKGKLLVTTRGISGRKPDASDPINAEWLAPLLTDLASGKTVDPKRRPRHHRAENTVIRDGLEIRYSDYMQPFADEIFKMYVICRPVQEKLLGVPPSEGMLASLLLLPTGGGGFSSGRTIGLGIWWGGFPQKKCGMVELLGHEAMHSWVHPFTEPLWNEGIATYVGIQMGIQLGYKTQAEKTLAGWIKRAKRHDPEMKKYDLAGGKDIPHTVVMAKPMWIWEQLRKEKPDILARYFKAKRRLADPKKLKRYTAHDSVAVLSIAAERDLFAWFQSLGISVNPDKATIKIPARK